MIVGLTGGIGSGKSTVAKMFEELGVPVYLADDAGKILLEKDTDVRQKVTQLLGTKAYVNGVPDRAFIASVVFNDDEKLQALNKIIHPAVRDHFINWYRSQKKPYVIKEAAILFESGSYKDCDAVITVTAPEKVRINRVISRDNTTEKEVRDRMKHQWDDSLKIERSDYVIHNTSLSKTRKEVRKIHQKLIKKLS